MSKLFDKLESPALTNINIDFPMGVETQQAYGFISDLYAGETISAVFKLNVLPSSLIVSGNTVDGVYSKNIDIGKNNNTSGIDVLWARSKIEGLMDKYYSNMSLVDRDKTKLEIISLALNYHLVSKFTSLVAVDVTPVRKQDQQLVKKAVSSKKALNKNTSISTPQTATSSMFWMLLGLFIMFIAYLTRFSLKDA